MTVLYHPEFARDIKRYSAQYAAISVQLGARFRTEVDLAIGAIKTNPTAAGHFIYTEPSFCVRSGGAIWVFFPSSCSTVWPTNGWYLAR